MKTKKTAPKFRTKGGLTLPQRVYLGRLATEAYSYLSRMGAIDGEKEKDWRHREAREATKDADPDRQGWSISEAPRSAFKDLETRFLLLGGKTARAVENAFGPDNDERQFTHLIGVAARTLGVGDSYVAGIARNMFHRPTWSGAAEGLKVLTALKKAIARQSKGES